MRSDFIRDHHLDAMRIAGERVGAGRERCIDVFNPFTNAKLGSVPKATLEEVKQAFSKAHAFKATLTRFERANILDKAAAIVRERAQEISALITAEAGLCVKDTMYE